jgi:hypothetical protein
MDLILSDHILKNLPTILKFIAFMRNLGDEYSKSNSTFNTFLTFLER